MDNVKLKVKPNQSYSGDRGIWYKCVSDFNGKTSTEYLEHFAKNPPTGVKNKEKKASFWLHFFERRGRVEFLPVGK